MNTLSLFRSAVAALSLSSFLTSSAHAIQSDQVQEFEIPTTPSTHQPLSTVIRAYPDFLADQESSIEAHFNGEGQDRVDQMKGETIGYGALDASSQGADGRGDIANFAALEPYGQEWRGFISEEMLGCLDSLNLDKNLKGYIRKVPKNHTIQILLYPELWRLKQEDWDVQKNPVEMLYTLMHRPTIDQDLEIDLMHFTKEIEDSLCKVLTVFSKGVGANLQGMGKWNASKNLIEEAGCYFMELPGSSQKFYIARALDQCPALATFFDKREDRISSLYKIIDNHPGAHNELAIRYQKMGDYVRAAQYYTMSANKGNVWAQAHLGYLYYAGQGVRQD